MQLNYIRQQNIPLFRVNEGNYVRTLIKINRKICYVHINTYMRMVCM